MEKKVSKQVELYFIWGIATVAVNVVLFYLFYNRLGMNYQLANLIDWVLTVLFAFVVNKLFVFRSSSPHLLNDLARFYGTRVLSYIVELIMLWIFISLLKIDALLSKVISHSLALVINYYLSKLIFLQKEVS